MTDIATGLTLESACSLLNHLMKERDARIVADIEWLKLNSPQASGSESADDDLAAKVKRRDQVLFCLGCVGQEHFRYADIEAVMRKEFPEAAQGPLLNVARSMSELAGGEIGILKSNPQRDAYMFKDPAFRTAIRAMLLRKGDTEAIAEAQAIASAINADGKLYVVRWV